MLDEESAQSEANEESAQLDTVHGRDRPGDDHERYPYPLDPFIRGIDGASGREPIVANNEELLRFRREIYGGNPYLPTPATRHRRDWRDSLARLSFLIDFAQTSMGEYYRQDQAEGREAVDEAPFPADLYDFFREKIGEICNDAIGALIELIRIAPGLQDSFARYHTRLHEWSSRGVQLAGAAQSVPPPYGMTQPAIEWNNRGTRMQIELLQLGMMLPRDGVRFPNLGSAVDAAVDAVRRRGQQPIPEDRAKRYRQIMAAWKAAKGNSTQKTFIAEHAAQFPGLDEAEFHRARVWANKHGRFPNPNVLNSEPKSPRQEKK